MYRTNGNSRRGKAKKRASRSSPTPDLFHWPILTLSEGAYGGLFSGVSGDPRSSSDSDELPSRLLLAEPHQTNLPNRPSIHLIGCPDAHTGPLKGTNRRAEFSILFLEGLPPPSAGTSLHRAPCQRCSCELEPFPPSFQSNRPAEAPERDTVQDAGDSYLPQVSQRRLSPHFLSRRKAPDLRRF